MNFKGRDCVSHMPQRLAGMDEMHGQIKELSAFIALLSLSTQSMVNFIQEKPACLAKLSVTKQILQKFHSQKSIS